MDQFGEDNHTLLLSKEYSDECVGLSDNSQTCMR